MKILFLVVLLLAGCASTAWVNEAHQLSDQGQCVDALNVIDRADVEFKYKLTLKGTVYQECSRDNNKAVAYLTLAARYGEKAAIEQLLEWGKPVPSADLAGSTNSLSAGNSDAALMLLMGGAAAYQQGKAAGYQSEPTPTPSTIDLKTNCTSRTIGSTVYTDCH